MQKIQLVDTFVKRIQLESISEQVTESTEFGFSEGYSEDNPETFIVEFALKINSASGFILELHYICQFMTDKPIDVEFKESAFPKVNAPAIGYPYLRAFVSNVLLSSGFEPAILPTINFQAQYNEAQKQISK